MKFLTIILGITIILLSLVPCQENSVGCAFEKECREESALCDEKGEHESEDVCSPFCLMNCCISGIVLAADQAYILAPASISSLTFSRISDKPHFFFCHSIWQPPKQS